MGGVCLGVGKSVMACSGGSEIKLKSYSRRKIAKYKTHGVPAKVYLPSELKQELKTRSYNKSSTSGFTMENFSSPINNTGL